jgi:RNA polymerase sigma factor (TIGR02999 family)
MRQPKGGCAPDLAGPTQVTILLSEARNGNHDAREKLLAAVYDQLHRLARRALRHEASNHTLQPTALVNELYLRVLAPDESIDWQNRAHFFAIAAQTLRRILVDHARKRNAERRGGGQIRLSLTAVNGLVEPRFDQVVAIDEALHRLAEFAPRASQIVELRFFGGLQEDEIAEALGVSLITVKRDWKVARAWLLAQLRSPSTT